MCGIAGGEKVGRIMEHLEHRGSSSKLDEDCGFAHFLHPVVGHVEQPLEGSGRLVANCEIYNWEELAHENGIEAENDAELLLELLDMKGVEALEELDGVYAFAYVRDGELILARDILGVKPLWFARDGFSLASERQALEKEGFEARELHPRQVMRYDLENDIIEFEQREFFEIDANNSTSSSRNQKTSQKFSDKKEVEVEEAAEKIKRRFLEAVEKRIPECDIALLFSGGVDSTMVAAALQELGKDFTCYTAGIQHGNVDAPRDSRWARDVADEMGLELETYEASLHDVEESVPELVDWISSTSPVKIGVALPFHLALMRNPEDFSSSRNSFRVSSRDEQVVLSGLGSEQLYAGYSRQKQGALNQEGISGLRQLFHEDMYRDDVISMRDGYELRLPFLDHELVEHAFTIPGDLKVSEEHRKYVLRKAAEKLGVPERVAWRKKRAAQYGSNFDKALSRLAKNKGFDSKQEYLNSFRDEPNHRLAALTSGGKDSNAALYRMQGRNSSIECLVNLQSDNPESYMFDSKEKTIVEIQAEELGVPLIIQETAGEKEEELVDLEEGLKKAKEEYGIDGVVAGAIASTYQRDRVEKVAEQLGLKAFTPLWMTDQESYLRWLVRKGFEVKITGVAARGLNEEWIGTTLDDETAEELIELSREYGFNAAGEGGEYETVVTGFP